MPKSWSLSLSVIGVTLLCGCGTPKLWYKDGGSQAEFKQDKYACEKDARQSGYFGGGIAGAINMQNFQSQCMESKGWDLR